MNPFYVILIYGHPVHFILNFLVVNLFTQQAELFINNDFFRKIHHKIFFLLSAQSGDTVYMW